MLSVRERAYDHDTKGISYMNSPGQGIKLVSLEDAGYMASFINKPRGNDLKIGQTAGFWGIISLGGTWLLKSTQVLPLDGIWFFSLSSNPSMCFVGWKRKLIWFFWFLARIREGMRISCRYSICRQGENNPVSVYLWLYFFSHLETSMSKIYQFSNNSDNQPSHIWRIQYIKNRYVVFF